MRDKLPSSLLLSFPQIFDLQLSTKLNSIKYLPVLISNKMLWGYKKANREMSFRISKQFIWLFSAMEIMGKYYLGEEQRKCNCLIGFKLHKIVCKCYQINSHWEGKKYPYKTVWATPQPIMAFSTIHCVNCNPICTHTHTPQSANHLNNKLPSLLSIVRNEAQQPHEKAVIWSRMAAMENEIFPVPISL